MKKQVYSRISRKFNTTPARVERVIRNAIELTWNRGDPDVLERLFGVSENADKPKPSNTDFFIKLAAELMDRRDIQKNAASYGCFV